MNKRKEMGKRLQKITSDDLHKMVEEAARIIVTEHDMRREIVLAQKEMKLMGQNIVSIGLRLDGTPYQKLFEELKDAAIRLNNALIKDIRKGVL